MVKPVYIAELPLEKGTAMDFVLFSHVVEPLILALVLFILAFVLDDRADRSGARAQALQLHQPHPASPRKRGEESLTRLYRSLTIPQRSFAHAGRRRVEAAAKGAVEVREVDEARVECDIGDLAIAPARLVPCGMIALDLQFLLDALATRRRNVRGRGRPEKSDTTLSKQPTL